MNNLVFEPNLIICLNNYKAKFVLISPIKFTFINVQNIILFVSESVINQILIQNFVELWIFILTQRHFIFGGKKGFAEWTSLTSRISQIVLCINCYVSAIKLQGHSQFLLL